MTVSPTKVRLAPALVLLAVLAAYANSFTNGFHFDDFHTVTDNPAVRSLRNVPRFFTDATTFSVLPANRTYRPVVSTSLAVDYAFGHGYEPFWFHLSTFCWFAVLLYVLWRLYTLLFESMGAGNRATWLALTGAAWFGLHPAMAETVNYVIQRGDLYCTLGCVAALHLYARYPARRKLGLYLLPLILALLSKPPAAVFPALLFLWVFFFEADTANRWKKSALAALPSLLLVVALLALQSTMTPRSFTPFLLSPADYRLTEPYVWARYCAELFLPIHLNADTDLAPFTGLSSRAVFGLLFLLALAAAIWKTARKRELYPIAFGLLWFVITQLPTSLYPLSEVENDHRMFFSFAGLIPGAVWGGWLLLHRLTQLPHQAALPPRLRPLLFGALAIALGAYAWGVHARNAAWRDEETLWRDDVEKCPHNGRGLMMYGLTQMNKGAYPQALDLFTRALEYTPNYATLEINIGIVNGLLNNITAAEQHFQRALFLGPNDDTTHTFYGRWLLSQGRTAEAVTQFQTAITLNPDREMSRQLLAQAAGVAGSIAAPTSAADWINRSLAQYRAGAYQESIASARHALELDPRSAAAFNNIGAGYGALGQFDQAVENETKAIALDPTLQIAQNNLAAYKSKLAAGAGRLSPGTEPQTTTDWINQSLTLYQQGKYPESIAAAESALRLDPSSAEAWNNIAAGYEALHDWTKAIDAAQKAIALRPDFQLAKNNLAWSQQQQKAGIR